MKICVFCGSLAGTNASYIDTATELGEQMAKRGVGLVYGGGNTGLMGAVAKGCALNGGDVHGIIPKALVTRERRGLSTEHDGTTVVPDENEYGRTTLVDDMHTRKRKMGEESDAFVALPGGFGTLEELMEVTTWSQLLIHSKPIVVLNINGFWDPFLKFIETTVDAGFVSEANSKIIIKANSVDEMFEQLEQFKVPSGRFNLNWSST